MYTRHTTHSWNDVMIRTVITVMTFAALLTFAAPAQAQRPWFGAGAREGEWIRYRYPLFREGNRPEHVRREAGDHYRRPYPYQPYRKYYGGFHSREFYHIGTPPGDIGFRGTPW